MVSLYYFRYIFSEYLLQKDIIGFLDYEVLKGVYEQMRKVILPIDLIIYIKSNADIVTNRLLNASRTYIPTLEETNDYHLLYEEFFHNSNELLNGIPVLQFFNDFNDMSRLSLDIDEVKNLIIANAN